MYCTYCGKEIAPQAAVCLGCGAPRPAAATTPFVGVETKSRLGAGLLGIFLGWLGVHRFYLGFNGIGLAQLLLGVLGLVTCGISTSVAWAWGFVEGILILAGVIDRDAWGNVLRD